MSRLGTLHACILVIAALTVSSAAIAAALRVSPVTIRVGHGKLSSAVQVWNDGRKAIQVQARIFREVHEGKGSTLKATRDVVVSPPITTLTPGAENTVRIVRVNPAPVTEKEKYRLVIDEVPNPKDVRAGQVKIMVRHAIPVVFE